MQAISHTPITQEEEREPSFLDRPVLGLTWWDWETAAFGALVLLAGVLRFWDLGSRALHHDESLHALFSWYLYTGAGYQHDPLMHGPFQFHATALIYLLFGDSDYTARVPPALIGAFTVALPYFLREQLGRTGALCTAALLALSPSVLYYNRFLREDTYVFAWNLLLVVALWRYLHTSRQAYLLLGAFALSLGFATKETTYLTTLIFGSYLLITSLQELLPRLQQRFDFRDASPRLGLLLMLGTLALPQGAAASLLLLRLFGVEAPSLAASPPGQLLTSLLAWWGGRVGGAAPMDPVIVGKLVVGIPAVALLVGLSMFIGWRWNWNLWFKVAAAFYIPFVVLFTTFFTNLPGLASGIWSGLDYWMTQQGVQRGGQPWFYYLILLPLYEFLPIVFALAGTVVYGLRDRFRDEFAGFLVWWIVASVLLYSYAGEKMPWLSLHSTLPLILLGGKTLGAFIERVPWARLWERGGIAFALVVPLLLLALRALLLALAPAPQPRPDGLLQLVLALGATALMGVLGWRLAQRLGVTLTGAAAATFFLVVLTALSVRAAWQASYAHGDIAVEMLVYTQTSPAVPTIMKNIERIADETGQGKEMPISVDSSDGFTWPWAWYLRDYKNVGYPCYGVQSQGEGCANAGNAPQTLMTSPPTASVLLLNAGNEAGAQPYLNNYDPGQPFPHRWWFSERYRDLTPSSLVSNLLDVRKWWDYFYLRKVEEPLGSSNAQVYYPKGRAPLTPSSPVTQPPSQPSPVAGEPVAADRVIGGRGPNAGGLISPKGVTVDALGNLYVVDSQANRVVKYNQEGQVVAQVGRAGGGTGEFTEPWGIAVDAPGNVYVADTWNHRVQKFDADLRFVTTWGSYANVPSGGAERLGSFFGPRAIAVDAEGNLYVTDTGNKRVQKFSPHGLPLASYGTAGSGPGQLQEPVGIAISASGELWVADTWNRRVQHFDKDFSYLGEFPIDGWQGQRIMNKPYLALDAQGNIVVTDPEQHRILRYTPQGQLLQRIGRLGMDPTSFNLPAAITVDKAGNLYISDSANGRVLRLPPFP